MGAAAQALLMVGAAAETNVVFDAGSATGTWTLTDGDHTAEVTGGASIRSILGTLGHSSGKKYFELVFVSGGSFSTAVRDDIGFTGDNPVPSGSSLAGNGAAYVRGGDIRVMGSLTGAVTALSSADVVGVAIDFSAGKAWFSLNGTYVSGDPAAGTSPSVTGLAPGTYYPGVSCESGSSMIATLRALADDFDHPIPTGFTSWGTT